MARYSTPPTRPTLPPAYFGPAAAPLRLDSIDALRGLAMLWMTVFHFCFDLAHFRLIAQNFHADPFWTRQRVAIVSLFLFCAGLSQAVALAQGTATGLGWLRFWRRWWQIVAAALLVTAGSWWMFPNSFIYFGVLHGIAVMLIGVRLTAGWGLWLWPLGALAMALPWVLPPWLASVGLGNAFDGPWLNWLGLVTRKPVTEDYVPVLPWLGVMWWGLAAGQWLCAQRPLVLARPVGLVGRCLAWLGRWSLSYYLLHQPVLMGLLMLWIKHH